MLKMVLLVSVAAGVGVLASDWLDEKLTPMVAKNASPGNKKAIKFGYTAGSAALTFALLNSLI